MKKGWSIIPIGGGKDKKAPLLPSWRKFQKRLPTGQEVEKWWSDTPNAKIGVITGKISQLVVVNIDDPLEFNRLGIKLINTKKVKTKKGFHFYYKYPEFDVHNSPIHNKQREQVGDIRAEGGYVIAPPSLHHDKNNNQDGQYEWVEVPDGSELPI